MYVSTRYIKGEFHFKKSYEAVIICKSTWPIKEESFDKKSYEAVNISTCKSPINDEVVRQRECQDCYYK